MDRARALDYFDKFCAADSLDSILSLYKKLCDVIRVKPTNFPDFFPKVSAILSSFDAQDLLSKYEKRAAQKCYENGKACQKSRILIIGAGPCGLRTAIEAQLLGAKVVVIEKRESFSRNNVLHLWPFLIADLKGLGAKKFYGKFCPGTIDHISINRLQFILLKVALLLGVEIHFGVGFENIIKPTVTGETKKGWRAKLSGDNHPLTNYEFDVMIGAGGKQTSLKFKRKILRAKLAIAITANFINNRTAAEAKVQEISGVSFIYKQDFFTELCQTSGIDLENIVYYKDETHYFVMTAKKHSLLWKGVLLHDHAETDTLLAPQNINREALKDYVREAVNYATEYKLPNLQFALNYRKEPDVALIDFTAMYQAENACRVVQRKGYKLLLGLVGDSLLEPFWPVGSGCARGFLSSFDVCWMLRSWSKGGKSVTEIISERESMYRLLAQTTHENLAKDYSKYTVDPITRYPHINLDTVKPFQVQNLYDSDELVSSSGGGGGGGDSKHKKKDSSIPVPSKKFNGSHLKPIQSKDKYRQSAPPTILCTKEEPEENQKEIETDDFPALDDLLDWFRDHVNFYGLEVEGIQDIYVKGNVLCAILHFFRSDLLPDFPIPPEVQQGDDEIEQAAFRNQLAFDFFKSEYSLPIVINGTEATTNAATNFTILIDYTVKVYGIFKNLKAPSQSLPKPKIQEPNESPFQPVPGLKRSSTSIESRNLPQRYFSSVWTLNRKYSNSNSNDNENGENGTPQRRLQRSSSIQRIVQRLDNNNNTTQVSSCGPGPGFRQLISQDETKPESIATQEVYANPYRTINNEIRRKRFEEAERSKVETLKLMHVLQTKKKEERDEERNKERERLIRAMRAQSAQLEPPEDTSTKNFKTMQTDDFFDEYKMRLWRQSKPSIGERTQKLETKLTGAALERNSSFCELPIHKLQEKERPKIGLARSATSVQVKASPVLQTIEKFRNKDNNVLKTIETKLAAGHGHTSFKPNFGQKAVQNEPPPPNTTNTTMGKRPIGKVDNSSFRAREISNGVKVEPKVTKDVKKPAGISTSASAVSLQPKKEPAKKNDFSEYFKAKEEAKAREARLQDKARERREAQQLQQEQIRKEQEAEQQRIAVAQRQARRLSEGRTELRLDIKEAVRRAEKMELRKDNIAEKVSYEMKTEPAPKVVKKLQTQNTFDEFDELFAEVDEDELLSNLTPDEVNHLLEWTEHNLPARGVDTQ